MTIRNLYRYEDEHGVTITPNKRSESDEPYCVRLIADEGKILTDGETETPCVDTHEPEKWYEVDLPPEPDEYEPIPEPDESTEV